MNGVASTYFYYSHARTLAPHTALGRVARRTRPERCASSPTRIPGLTECRAPCLLLLSLAPAWVTVVAAAVCPSVGEP